MNLGVRLPAQLLLDHAGLSPHTRASKALSLHPMQPKRLGPDDMRRLQGLLKDGMFEHLSLDNSSDLTSDSQRLISAAKKPYVRSKGRICRTETYSKPLTKSSRRKTSFSASHLQACRTNWQDYISRPDPDLLRPPRQAHIQGWKFFH